ncbi:OTU domain-containing protein 5-A-like [Clavelina lepadiformis]|uniref:ubiquitinyl hydrolase 1 n=1 Tax=Clavelina lepadiformis TaxID=159417 RepID=A0ABP0FUC4_CLALP
MTILPKKKTGKDKTATEQGSHDHHSSNHQSHHTISDNRARLEPVSVRTSSHSSNAGDERHRTNRIRHSTEFVTLPSSADGAPSASSHGAAFDNEENVQACVVDAKPLNRTQAVNADISDGIKQPSTDAACASTDSSSMVTKRRHGRLSPHTQPYTRTKPTRCSNTVTDNSACCSSAASTSSYHHTASRRHLPIEERRPNSPSIPLNANNSARNARRRQRSRTDGKDDKGGNNSDDEHDATRLRHLNQGVDFEELEIKFARALKEIRGFHIKEMVEDGACLFRAVAEQVYGDQNMHDEVRRNCMDYMMKNSDFFSNYVTEDFVTYICRKRLPHTYGNHLEMQAMAEMYNRIFEVYQYSTEPINTFQSSHLTDNVPIRVSYHKNSHYNAVIDPYKASVGVGLGLPSFRPGLADRMLLQEALRSSEQEILEEQMLEDKLRAADWENTEDELLRTVAQESFVQYLHDQGEMARGSSVSKPGDDQSSSKQPTCSHNAAASHSPKPTENKVENRPDLASTSQANAFAQQFGTPGLGDWVDETEENNILAQVMAQSQREYYDTLTKSNKQDDTSSATCSKYASS